MLQTGVPNFNLDNAYNVAFPIWALIEHHDQALANPEILWEVINIKCQRFENIKF